MKIVDIEKIIKISFLDCFNDNVDLIERVNQYLSKGWILLGHNFGTNDIETYLLGFPRSNSTE